jgi:hypothetical protein
MVLRYNILYVRKHIIHLEAENCMVHEMPLEWLPIDIKKCQLLLVNLESIDGIISPKLAVLEHDGSSPPISSSHS